MAFSSVFIIICYCSASVLAQVWDQNDLNNMAAGLKVKWKVLTNTKQYGTFEAEIILENQAVDLNLTYGDWEIHLNCIFRIEPDLIGILGNKEVVLKDQSISLTHIQGDHFYLKPTANFITLTAGGTRKIKLHIGDYSVSRTDALFNWYITSPNLQPVVIASTQGEDLRFVEARSEVQQWKRFDADEYNPYTPQVRYERNYVADSSYKSEIRVIPKPTSLFLGSNGEPIKIAITKSWVVSYEGQLENEALYLAASLDLQPPSTVAPGPNVIHLKLGDSHLKVDGITLNTSDAYCLTVNATSSKIDIVGQGSSGVFYGAVTLLSLMDESRLVPECVVIDGPRFEYRGLMLDIARSFHPKEDILKLIEVMASYKLNKLHLHLSDDEGWRIEIPALPELTKFGSQRCHDPSETICLMPQLGSGPDNSTRFGSGFLTTADYIEILKLANARHVTVIPEIDMPGHSRAAILSMKLRNITQTSQGNVGINTTLTETGDSSEYTSPQMYSDNAINPCLESTYNFINIIMDEFRNLHNQGQQPLKLFHFGGDEVGRGAWINSTSCQILKDSGRLLEDSFKWYFFQRVSALAAGKNLSLGGWEDGVMHDGNKPFNISASPVKDFLAYAWNNVWEAETLSRTYRLANSGYKVVLIHASHLYLDHPYEPDPEERGTYWATRFTDTKKLFSYNAEHYYDNTLVKESGAPITKEELCGPANESCPLLTSPENIVGMQGALFSETTRTSDHLHHNLLPKLLALAERAWHRASWESLPVGEQQDEERSKDWSSFARAVGYRELPRLDQRNVTYRIPPPGAVISFGRLLTTPLYPSLVVQYSFDAGTTWQDVHASESVVDYKYRIWLRTRTADSRRYSRTVVLDQAPPLAITIQPIIDYIGQYMDVNYTVVDNYKKYGDDFYEARIRLSNVGDEVIPGGNWKIYFVSVNVVEPTHILQGHEYVDNVAKITISHVKGYLYSLGPSTDFTELAAGEHLEFSFKVQYWSVSRYEQMPRWYVSSPGMNARNIKHTVDEALAFVSPFTQQEQWKRFDFDKFDPWTPEVRYDRNAAWEVTPLPSCPVIPTPISYTTQSNKLINLLNGSWAVLYDDSSLKSISLFFKELMSEFFPQIDLDLNQTTRSDRYIRFRLGNIPNNTKNSTEAYKVQVQATPQVVDVTGATPDGVFYGAITLIQTALKTNPGGSLTECQIEDWPRFTYRGMHVDTARNFIPKDTILKLLKVMSLYKLNKFHFHLSDDEGWRLQIPSMPELTKVGGRRCHNLKEMECVMSTLGSGADDTNSGSGYYTVADYQEILRLAERLHIEVIPEFDMPGHAHAAIRSMKARQTNLKDLGNHVHSDDHVLNDDEDTSYYFSVQYYTDNAVNPCVDSLYRFIVEIYTQVKEMHQNIQPLRTYHFGGDEVAKGAWVNSTACAGLLRSGVNLKSLFTQRVSNITREVALAAWEDGLMDHDSLPWDRKLLANEDVIVQAWQNVWEWGVASRAYNLANRGYKVVFSPVTHTYFDHPQEPSPDERGFYWGTRYTDAFKTFSFMPDHYYLNADIKRSGEPITLDEICGKDFSGCPPLNKTENILGLQGQLWSETVRLPGEFEYMVFPRLLSLAERAWHKSPWEGKDAVRRNPELKSDWARFASSLGSKDLSILDKLGVNYRVPPPGAKQMMYTISTKVEYPGLQVQYKVPGSNWANLPPSTTFTEGQEVTLRTTSADGKRFSSEVKVSIMKIGVQKDGAASISAWCLSSLLCIIAYLIQVL